MTMKSDLKYTFIDEYSYTQNITFRKFDGFADADYVYEKNRVISLKLAQIRCDDLVSALKGAKTSDKFKGLNLVNVPTLIQLMKTDATLADLTDTYIDTVSGQYQTKIKQDKVYLISHRNHPLTSSNILANGFKSLNTYEFRPFLPIKEKEMHTIIKDACPIDRLRKGREISDRTIIINLDKDNPTIHQEKTIEYDSWMKDDLVLAMCGSEENRTWLGEYLKRKNIHFPSSYDFRIPKLPFDKSYGRLLAFHKELGLLGSGKGSGCFMGVTPNPEIKEEKVLVPPLEQIMEISSEYVAPCNIDDLEKELSDLFKKIRQTRKISVEVRNEQT